MSKILLATALLLSACSSPGNTTSSSTGSTRKSSASASAGNGTGGATSGGNGTSGTSGANVTGGVTNGTSGGLVCSSQTGQIVNVTSSDWMPHSSTAVSLSQSPTSRAIQISLADSQTTLCEPSMNTAQGALIDLFVDAPTTTPITYDVTDGGVPLATLQVLNPVHQSTGGWGGDVIAGHVTIQTYDNVNGIQGSYSLEFAGRDDEVGSFKAVVCTACP